MFYPVFLKLQNKKCLILGGGAVAERKARTLLKAGSRVTVVSLDFTPGLKRLAKRNRQLRLRAAISWMRLLRFSRNDIALAFACTSSHRENLKFSKECQKRGIWVNQADDLGASDFLVPALFQKGRLQIAISTSGLSPYLARELKKRMGGFLRKEDLRFLEWLASRARRQQVIQSLANPRRRKLFFQKLIHPRFLRLFRKPETAKIETHFKRLLKEMI